MWKHFISDYLSFTKKDRSGILMLFIGIVFFLLLPFFYPFFIKQKVYDRNTFEKSIASLIIQQVDSSVRLPNRYPGNHRYQNDGQSATVHNYSLPYRGELFYFDPNSASPSDWKRLGLKDKTISTIQNYLLKGGKFYKKEDIRKIWGLQEAEVLRLMPYIILETPGLSKNGTKYINEKNEYRKETYSPSVVDINRGDAAAFIALPGIGSKLSQRIINFREKLGGFYNLEQVGETYGLPDSTFQKLRAYLRIDPAALRQININSATISEMKVHPYIGFALANSIVQYRTQHGKYGAISDIEKIMTVTADIFNKVAPYLSTE